MEDVQGSLHFEALQIWLVSSLLLVFYQLLTSLRLQELLNTILVALDIGLMMVFAIIGIILRHLMSSIHLIFKPYFHVVIRYKYDIVQQLRR